MSRSLMLIFKSIATFIMLHIYTWCIISCFIVLEKGIIIYPWFLTMRPIAEQCFADALVRIKLYRPALLQLTKLIDFMPRTTSRASCCALGENTTWIYEIIIYCHVFSVSWMTLLLCFCLDSFQNNPKIMFEPEMPDRGSQC